MKGKPQNAICAGVGERKFALWRNGESDDGHFPRCSGFADLAYGFDDALRAWLKTGGREQVIRSEDHEVEILATGFVGEFIDASGLRGFDAGAVVADVEHHDFNEIANAAIRVAE